MTLTVDGSEDYPRDPIANIVGLCGDHTKPIYLKQHNFGTELHSADDYCNIVSAQMDTLVEWGAIPTATLTDNCSAMIGFGKEMVKKGVIDQGAPCHALDLVLNWVARQDEFATVLEEMRAVQNDCRVSIPLLSPPLMLSHLSSLVLCVCLRVSL